jgi:hypothetical protein
MTPKWGKPTNWSRDVIRFHVYLRVLGPLRSETRLAVALAIANIALAALQFIEPVLFGVLASEAKQSSPATQPSPRSSQ